MTKENETMKRIKRFTALGAAFLMFLAVSAGVWTVITKTYAFAQRVEVYVGLPDWLKRVEQKQDDLRADMKKGFQEQNEKLDRILAKSGD